MLFLCGIWLEGCRFWWKMNTDYEIITLNTPAPELHIVAFVVLCHMYYVYVKIQLQLQMI